MDNNKKNKKISIKNLKIAYSGSNTNAVCDASLDIEKGRLVGLVGESGSGKSTVLMSIPRLLPVGTKISGEIILDGINLLTIPDEELRKIRWRKIAIVPQGAFNSFTPTLTIGAHIREVLKVHLGMNDKREVDEKIKSLLVTAGLEPMLAGRYPHELSGGQKQRAAIATALACDPDFLLADEPTTALDVVTQREVLNTLVEIVRERGMGMLLVTHDLPLAKSVCDSLVVMREGEILGYPDDDEYTGKLLAASLLTSADSPRPFGAPPSMREAKDGAKIFETKKLRVNFGKRGEVVALRDVSISLKRGETLSVVGETGSGKTTLLRSILGLVEAKGVSLFGRNLSELSDGEKIKLRRRCGYVAQDPYGSLPPTLTVLQAVMEPWLVVGKNRVEGEHRAREILDELKLDASLWNSRVRYALSGGQRQRVLIARALMLEPELLLADEPTAMQDISTRGEILSVFERRVAAGMSMVFVTHDLYLARYASQNCVVLWSGQIVERLESADILTAAGHPYTKSLVSALPRVEGR